MALYPERAYPQIPVRTGYNTDMNRPRLIRGLRIAVSAVCGILCVLLVVLWVRSYSSTKFFVAPFLQRGSVLIESAHGRLTFGYVKVEEILARDFLYSSMKEQLMMAQYQQAHQGANRSSSTNQVDRKVAALEQQIARYSEDVEKVFLKFWQNFLPPIGSRFAFSITKSAGISFAIVPYWLLLGAAIAVFAALPLLRWSFSLRTLLIATTVIAVVLGLVVYATR